MEQGSREDENLSAGGSYSAPGYFDVKAALGVLLASQGWIVEGLMPRLPVAHSLPDGLQDTKQSHQVISEVQSADTLTTLKITALPHLTHNSQDSQFSNMISSGGGGGHGNGPIQSKTLDRSFSGGYY